MAEKKEKKTFLDGIKEMDKKVRKLMVYRKLNKMKKWAKQVLEMKEKTQVLLEELGVEEKDIKRLIDYINNDVALTDEDKKDIRDSMKREVREEKEEISEEMELPSNAYVMHASGTNLTVGDGATYMTTISGSTDIDFDVK